MPRLDGSFTIRVEDNAGGGGLVVAAVLNALYRVVPSGVNVLPPTFCAVLKAAVVANGALALFCCAIMLSVAVSYMVKPAMNREPSGATESTLEAPETVRLRSTTCDAVFVHKDVGAWRWSG